jgi:hypothetical protein
MLTHLWAFGPITAFLITNGFLIYHVYQLRKKRVAPFPRQRKEQYKAILVSTVITYAFIVAALPSMISSMNFGIVKQLNFILHRFKILF